MRSELLIGGVWRPAANGASFPCHDRTGAVVGQAAAATTADALAAVEAAQVAFPGWAATDSSWRRGRILAVAHALAERQADLTDAAMAEAGATAERIKHDLQLATAILQEAAAFAAGAGGEVIPPGRDGRLSVSVARPRGACLGIAAPDAPISLAVRAVAMAVAVGNTMVFKASSRCPVTHRLIGNCFCDAGLPPGVINVLSVAPDNAPQIIETLIRAEEIRHVNFTGPACVARIIGRVAGEALTPALLDADGSAPLIVLDDADIATAVAAAVACGFGPQAGCRPATCRVIVTEGIADDFLAALPGQLKSVLRVGDAGAAVREANAGGCSPAAAIFSRDTVGALKLAEGLEAVICHINGPPLPGEPQGGFGGRAGIAEFTVLRRITIAGAAPPGPL